MKMVKMTTIVALLMLFSQCTAPPPDKPNINLTETVTDIPLLRHVVLFSFNETSEPEAIQQIEVAFAALQSKIPQIHSYEWGLNNSPEGLDKGFTHCFFLTFKSEEDRAIYLPHPDHKAFGDLLGPHLKDVLVIDYWAK